MKFLFFCAVLSFFFLIQSAYSQPFFTIKGITSNAETNEPVPNANIVIADNQIGTSSDSNGSFEFQLAAGEYKFRITSVGFSSKNISVHVPGESTDKLRIELVPSKHEIEGIDVFGQYFIPDRDTSVNRIPTSLLPAMTTVSAAEIQKQGAVTLVDAMKYVPGGWTETRGRKTKQFFSVRGQKYPYPDYSINGMWQKEFEETGYFMSALDIESIEIVRSGSALVKGLSGLTGVVDVKTRNPSRETISMLAKYGEQNNYLTNLQYGNKISDLSFIASASYFGTDGPQGRNGKERIGNIYGNFDWQLSDKFSLMAGTSYISGMRQLLRIEDEVGAPNIKNRIEKYDPVRTLLTYMKLNYRGNDKSLTELQSNFSTRDVDFTSYNIPQETAASHKENDWEYGLNILHSRPISQNNTLRIGGLYNHWEAPEGKRYYVGRSCNVHTFSGVIASEQKAGKFLFDAGFRIIGGYIVEWGGFGIEGSAAGFQNVAPIENQGAPTEWQSAAGAAFIISGASSLHYNFSGGTIAPRKGGLTNDGVAPENEGRFQHDFGFRHKTINRNEISVSAFFTQRNNAIDFSGQTIVTENDLVMELYENRDKRTYGIEMSAKMNIPVMHGYFFANGLLMKGEKKSNGSMIEDEQMPKIILNTGLYFDYAGFDANMFLNYTGRYYNNRFVIPSWVQQYGNFMLGDFVSADMNAGYTFSGTFEKRLFIEVRNVFNKNFMTVAGYPDSGRLLSAGIKISR